MHTEFWWFTLIDDELEYELRTELRHRANHQFGPAGMLEQDDGENWAESTVGSRGLATRGHPLNYAMDLGRGTMLADEKGPARLETPLNEHAQLWLYQAWADWIESESWSVLETRQRERIRSFS